MATTYSWSFTALDCAFGPDAGGNTDVVEGVIWRYSGTDDQGRVCSVPGRSILSVTEHTQFIELGDVAESDVVAWIESAVGEDEMAAMRDEIDADISEQAEPTRTILLSHDLPWVG